MQNETEPTIEPLKSMKELECKNIGLDEGLSKLDIQKINLVYNCKNASPKAEPEPETDAAADAWYSNYGHGHPGYYGAYRRYYGRGWGEYYGGYYGYPSYE